MSSITRHKIWRVLNLDHDRSRLGRYLNVALAALIFLNIAAIAAETVPWVTGIFGPALTVIEYVSVGVFSIEYLLRLWTCVEDPRYAHLAFGRLRYALTPMALIDLAAIAPFYLPWMGVNLLTLRAFRLLRLLRLLKLGRYSEALHTMGRVVSRKRFDLASTVVIAIVLLMVAASLLHAVEGTSQADQFGTIPDSMWWAVETMTTVGYGDVYPKTPLGRFIGSIVAFLGVGLFALPTAILGAGFLEETNRKARAEAGHRNCPHCGGDLEP